MNDLPVLGIRYAIDYQLEIPFFRRNYYTDDQMRTKLASAAYKAAHASYVAALDAHDELEIDHHRVVIEWQRPLVEAYFNEDLKPTPLGWPSATDVPMLAFRNDFVNNNDELRDAMSFKLLKVSTPPPSPPSDAEETKDEAEAASVDVV